MNIMYLEDEASWPSEVVSFLEQNHSVFLGWESGENRPHHTIYDDAHYKVDELLRASGYCLHGYHCTRLTDAEINTLLAEGMSLPNRKMLERRVKIIEEDGLISATIAQSLRDQNQADERYRANMIWFCFFLPHLAGESGIERFFRHWGGEALYNSHENDPVSGPALANIGVPCIVEANVLLLRLFKHSYLVKKLCRRFLVTRGFQTSECMDHEGFSVEAIPVENIVRVIRYPEADFISLTACNEWHNPIEQAVNRRHKSMLRSK